MFYKLFSIPWFKKKVTFISATLCVSAVNSANLECEVVTPEDIIPEE